MTHHARVNIEQIPIGEGQVLNASASGNLFMTDVFLDESGGTKSRLPGYHNPHDGSKRRRRLCMWLMVILGVVALVAVLAVHKKSSNSKDTDATAGSLRGTNSSTIPQNDIPYISGEGFEVDEENLEIFNELIEGDKQDAIAQEHDADPEDKEILKEEAGALQDMEAAVKEEIEVLEEMETAETEEEKDLLEEEAENLEAQQDIHSDKADAYHAELTAETPEEEQELEDKVDELKAEEAELEQELLDMKGQNDNEDDDQQRRA